MDAASPQPKTRIQSIDILRGIVMIIMALDHTRDFFSTQQGFDPTDLRRASTALFLTRFITHYCAACFVFLAGTSAFLSLSRGKTKGQAARFLITRGLWLILLELTLVNWGFFLNTTGGPSFNFDYSFVFVQVIWVTGIGMIIMAGLIYLPVPAITAIGLLLIFTHNLFDGIDPKGLGSFGDLWQFLHVQGIVGYANNTRHVFVLYPLIPWIGVMAAGYGFGTLFKMEAAKRKQTMRIIGVSAIALFVVIRAFNLYGDPNPWVDQHCWYRSLLSFINARKYPPSLDYLLITIGPGVLFLSYIEGISNRLTNIFLVFGRVPLFYYLLHLYLLQLLTFITFRATQGMNIKFGFGLPVVYAFWFLVVFILYFPCRWYMNYKARHTQWWLSYL
jgi:uncharacterized membrane protein